MAIKIKVTSNYTAGNKISFTGKGGGFRAFSPGAAPPLPTRLSVGPVSSYIWGGGMKNWLISGIDASGTGAPGIGGIDGDAILWDVTATSGPSLVQPCAVAKPLVPAYNAISDALEIGYLNEYEKTSYDVYFLTRENSSEYSYLARYSADTDTFSTYQLQLPGAQLPDMSARIYHVDCLKKDSNGNIWFVVSSSSGINFWKFDTTSKTFSGSLVTDPIMVDSPFYATATVITSFVIDGSDNIWACGMTGHEGPGYPNPFVFKLDTASGQQSVSLLRDNPASAGYQSQVGSIVNDEGSQKVWITGRTLNINEVDYNYTFWSVDKNTFDVLSEDVYADEAVQTLSEISNSPFLELSTSRSTAAILGDPTHIWNFYKSTNNNLFLIDIDTSTGVITNTLVDSDQSIREMLGKVIHKDGSIYLCTAKINWLDNQKDDLMFYKVDLSTSQISSWKTPGFFNKFWEFKVPFNISSSDVGKIAIVGPIATEFITELLGEYGSAIFTSVYDPTNDSFTNKVFTMFSDGSTQEYTAPSTTAVINYTGGYPVPLLRYTRTGQSSILTPDGGVSQVDSFSTSDFINENNDIILNSSFYTPTMTVSPNVVSPGGIEIYEVDSKTGIFIPETTLTSYGGVVSVPYQLSTSLPDPAAERTYFAVLGGQSQGQFFTFRNFQQGDPSSVAESLIEYERTVDGITNPIRIPVSGNMTIEVDTDKINTTTIMLYPNSALTSSAAVTLFRRSGGQHFNESKTVITADSPFNLSTYDLNNLIINDPYLGSYQFSVFSEISGTRQAHGFGFAGVEPPPPPPPPEPEIYWTENGGSPQLITYVSGDTSNLVSEIDVATLTNGVISMNDNSAWYVTVETGQFFDLTGSYSLPFDLAQYYITNNYALWSDGIQEIVRIRDISTGGIFTSLEVPSVVDTSASMVIPGGQMSIAGTTVTWPNSTLYATSSVGTNLGSDITYTGIEKGALIFESSTPISLTPDQFYEFTWNVGGDYTGTSATVGNSYGGGFSGLLDSVGGDPSSPDYFNGPIGDGVTAASGSWSGYFSGTGEYPGHVGVSIVGATTRPVVIRFPTVVAS